MKLTIALICATLLSVNSWAQQINGKVLDGKTNAPLIGATVKSTVNTYTTTDKDGKFSINCQENMVISISFIGYNSYQLSAKCGDKIVVQLSTKENKINEVEVSGNKNQVAEFLEEPKAIVKLGLTELKRGDGLFLDDAINANVPGVYMQRRSSSGGQQFNIRGFGNGLGFKGANNNFDGQGTKVYLNGIPITDAEGVTVLDDIDMASISNLKVSKGPSGTLYGLAIAGVINFEMQKAKANETSIGERLTLGSYGLLRSTTHVSIGTEKSSLLVNYGRQEFDGFMTHTVSHKDFVNFMGDVSLDEKQSIRTYFGYSNSYDERNGELTAKQYEEKEYSGNTRYIQNDAHSAVKTFRAGITHAYEFNDHISNSTTFFGSSQLMDNSSAGGWNDKSPLSYGLRSTVDLSFDLTEMTQLKGIVGIELQKTQAIANGYQMEADSTNLSGYNIIGKLRSAQSLASSTATYFTQWRLNLPKEFSLIAGLSLSSMDISLNDRLWVNSNNHFGNTTPKEYERKFDQLLAPSVSINKKVNEVASIYATYSIAYKTPVGSQFYIPTTGEVNQDLNAEKGAQIEVGTKGSLLNNRLYYSVAVFNAAFTDKLTTVSVQNPENTATLYSYVTNGGGMSNNGLEVLVKYNAIQKEGGFITAFQPFANVTYSDYKYKDFNYQKVGKGSLNQDTAIIFDYSGNTVAGVPRIVFNLGFDVATKIGLYANVSLNYRDEMYYTSDELNRTDSYSLLNAKIGYQKSIKHFDFDLFAGANNITSSQYYYMVFLNQLPDAYIPAPNEINYFGGINVKYKF